MTQATYDSIKSDIPLIVRQVLESQNEAQRQIYAEEFSKRYRTSSGAYFSLICLFTHRWYLGKPILTILQWALISTYGIGLIWVVIDMLLMPELINKRNAEIAKAILDEQIMLNEKLDGLQQATSQPLPARPTEHSLDHLQTVNVPEPSIFTSGLQGICFYILFLAGAIILIVSLIQSGQGLTNTSNLLGGIGLIISGILLRPHVRQNVYKYTPVKKASYIALIVISAIIFSLFNLGNAVQESITDLEIKAKAEYSISPDTALATISSYAGKGNWKNVKIMTNTLSYTGDSRFKELHDRSIKEIDTIEQQRRNEEYLRIANEKTQEEAMKFNDELPVKAEKVCEMLEGTGLTMGCKLNYSEQSIDVKINTTGTQAIKICSDTSKMVASIYPFKGTWRLRIFSPFASRPMTVCLLK